MKREECRRIEQELHKVATGQLVVLRHSVEQRGPILLTDQFSAKTEGRGRVEAYSVLPGIDASYMTILAPQIDFHHAATRSVLELFYCRSGRVGWNMQGGSAIYLGAGDLAIHGAAYCADSAMMFPLGYVEGIAVALDLPTLAQSCPAVLQETGIDFQQMERNFCEREPRTVSACPQLDRIFMPLFLAKPDRRGAYLQLKVQELLLYLMELDPEPKAATQYFSQQTERVKEIHRQMTRHLERRYTIEELSKQYLINTSTLKEVFKAVYGLPIARYMKEYRVREAMRMLRETDDAIFEIAGRLGYETQGKFSEAFKQVAQMLPSEYRRLYREQGRKNP